MVAKGEMTLAATVFDPDCTVSIKAMEIKGFIRHAQRQMDQIERRVIGGEVIPHEEKVFPFSNRTPNGSAKVKRVFPSN